jgi:hypothetical protein
MTYGSGTDADRAAQTVRVNPHQVLSLDGELSGIFAAVTLPGWKRI